MDEQRVREIRERAMLFRQARIRGPAAILAAAQGIAEFDVPYLLAALAAREAEVARLRPIEAAALAFVQGNYRAGLYEELRAALGVPIPGDEAWEGEEE